MKAADRALITRTRLASQFVSDSRAGSAGEVVRWMTAMQAQDLPGAKWSVGLRMPGGTVNDIDDALNGGEVVRSWPFRGTLHFVAAEDLGWMLDLTATRTIASAAGRFRQLGLDQQTLDRARAIAEQELQGGRAATRDTLFAAFQAGGVSTEGQRGANTLWYLAHVKSLCFGPMQGNAQALVLLDEWIEHPRRPERDESLGELALRYFSSHGPVTLKDFLWWSKVFAKDAQLGLDVARPELESLELDDATYWMAAGTMDAQAGPLPRTATDVHLLPGFDEYILGYTDRSAQLDPEHFERIVPGGNGMFMPTIVAGGHVDGTWSKRVTTKGVSVSATPFVGLSQVKVAGIRSRALGYAHYLGLPLSAVDVPAAP